MYFWSNWAGAKFEFFDKDGKSTFVYNNGNLNDTGGNEHVIEISEPIMCKQLKITVIHAKGVKNMTFVELILNVGEPPVEEE